MRSMLQRAREDTRKRISLLALEVFGGIMPARERAFNLGIVSFFVLLFVSGFIYVVIERIREEGLFEWFRFAALGLILTAGLVGLIMWGLRRFDPPTGEPVTLEMLGYTGDEPLDAGPISLVGISPERIAKFHYDEITKKMLKFYRRRFTQRRFPRSTHRHLRFSRRIPGHGNRG